jgi:competence protein ComEA
LPEGDGKDLVQKVCASCHSVGLITTHHQGRNEWTTTVQRMAEHGASATDEQFNTIVNYLTNNFGPDLKPNN